jgi:hypothetical protein
MSESPNCNSVVERNEIDLTQKSFKVSDLQYVVFISTRFTYNVRMCVSRNQFSILFPFNVVPGYRSRYSGWLWARRPRSREFESWGAGKNSQFSMSSRPAVGSTQPLIQWVPGTLSPGVKQQKREADHSPPISAEVKKPWAYTSTPQYGVVLN